MRLNYSPARMPWKSLRSCKLLSFVSRQKGHEFLVSSSCGVTFVADFGFLPQNLGGDRDQQMILCDSMNGGWVMRTLESLPTVIKLFVLGNSGMLKETPCETFTTFNLQKCYDHVESYLYRRLKTCKASCFVEGATKKCSALAQIWNGDAHYQAFFKHYGYQ